LKDKKQDLLDTAKNGVEIQKIIDAIYKSAETKKEIMIQTL